MTVAPTDLTPCVGPDSYLTLHYRIVLASGPGEGSVFTDTFDGRPGTLQLGTGQWAPGMEARLIGQPEGSRFSLTLSAVEAYGDRNPELVQRISRRLLDENAGADASFTPGDLVEFAAPNGGRYSGVLKAIDTDSALFDFNHPLAGADLRVDVAILGVL